MNYLTDEEKCPKCKHSAKLIVKPDFISSVGSTACRIGSDLWDIRDLTFSTF